MQGWPKGGAEGANTQSILVKLHQLNTGGNLKNLHPLLWFATIMHRKFQTPAPSLNCCGPFASLIRKIVNTIINGPLNSLVRKIVTTLMNMFIEQNTNLKAYLLTWRIEISLKFYFMGLISNAFLKKVTLTLFFSQFNCFHWFTTYCYWFRRYETMYTGKVTCIRLPIKALLNVRL